MADFELLKSLSDILKKRSELTLTLDQLKAKTDEYIKLRNQVVDEIWLLKAKNTRVATNDERLLISIEIKEIQKKLNACQSEDQIALLINEIKNKEMEENGHSNLDSNSPYILLCKA
jgi:hypothetical protein